MQIESENKKQINLRFGSAVKHFRHLLGVSQEGLAELAGLDRTYIGHVERGARNVSLSTIDRLARALKISTATLLSKLGDPGRGAAGLGGGGVEILLVERRKRDIDLTLRAFKRAHIANPIHVCSDGAEALAFVFGEGKYSGRSREGQLALVLLDLDLPSVSGIHVLRRIKRDPRTRHLPVIVLASSRNDHSVHDALCCGAAAYIVKPVGFENLTQITPKLNLSWQLIARRPESRRR